jgi:hypothetical protein
MRCNDGSNHRMVLGCVGAVSAMMNEGPVCRNSADAFNKARVSDTGVGNAL